MIFTNPASEAICCMISSMSKAAEDMRKLELNDFAINEESEIDGLFMALAICERCSTFDAKDLYYRWIYTQEHKGE